MSVFLGTSWCEVDCPDPKSHISHVSVGEACVWALSRDRRVWLRNGIRASSGGESESLAKGTKWIEMVGELHMISIGPGDQVEPDYIGVVLQNHFHQYRLSSFLFQVLGITDEEHQVVFRTGVTPSDLSGKTWKPITAQTVRLRSFSGSSSISSQVSVVSQQQPNQGQIDMIKRMSETPEVCLQSFSSTHLSLPFYLSEHFTV